MAGFESLLPLVVAVAAVGGVVVEPSAQSDTGSFLNWLFSEPAPPVRPFRLSRSEQCQVDATLAKWEQAGSKLVAFSSRFTQWSYDPIWGPRNNNCPWSEARGVLKFRAPDSGLWLQTERKVYSAIDGNYHAAKDPTEYLCCDGRSVYVRSSTVKIVNVFPVPPGQAGQIIRSSPLALLVPIRAKELRDNYWIREETPHERAGKQVWIEAWPKVHRRFFSAQKYEVILSLPDYLPVGLQISRGRARIAYLLEEFQVNAAASVTDADFNPPKSQEWKVIYHGDPPPVAKLPPPLKHPAAMATPTEAATIRSHPRACCSRKRYKPSCIGPRKSHRVLCRFRRCHR